MYRSRVLHHGNIHFMHLMRGLTCTGVRRIILYCEYRIRHILLSSLQIVSVHFPFFEGHIVISLIFSFYSIYAERFVILGTEYLRYISYEHIPKSYSTE